MSLLVSGYIVLFFNVLWWIIYPKTVVKIIKFKSDLFLSIFFYMYLLMGILCTFLSLNFGL